MDEEIRRIRAERSHTYRQRERERLKKLNSFYTFAKKKKSNDRRTVQAGMSATTRATTATVATTATRATSKSKMKSLVPSAHLHSSPPPEPPTKPGPSGGIEQYIGVSRRPIKNPKTKKPALLRATIFTKRC